MPGSYFTGSMVQAGEVSSRKCVRTSSSKTSSTKFQQKQVSKIEVFDKDGRFEVFGNDQIKERDMGLSYYMGLPQNTSQAN